MPNELDTTGPTDAQRLRLVERKLEARQTAFGKIASQGLELAIEIGLILTEARELVPAGKWLEWLPEHFKGTARCAQQYMRIAANAPEVLERAKTCSHSIGISGALELLSTPRVEKQATEDGQADGHADAANAADGEPTAAEVREIVQKRLDAEEEPQDDEDDSVLDNPGQAEAIPGDPPLSKAAKPSKWDRFHALAKEMIAEGEPEIEIACVLEQLAEHIRETL
jgi:hypothetical protein